MTDLPEPPGPFTPDEIARISGAPTTPMEARLIATIRDREARLERLRDMPYGIQPAVLNQTGQLAITITTPERPRGELFTVPVGLSLQIAGAIIQAQGFVPVQNGANGAETSASAPQPAA